ncbi:hypothetical protein J3R74_001464 [Puniceicoccus vermicola]
MLFHLHDLHDKSHARTGDQSSESFQLSIWIFAGQVQLSNRDMLETGPTAESLCQAGRSYV